FSRPSRGAFPDSGLRPGGQALPDLVLVSALERLQNLHECRSGHRLPLGPGDGGEVRASRTPREEQRHAHHPDEGGTRVLGHGHLTGWKGTPWFYRRGESGRLRETPGKSSTSSIERGFRIPVHAVRQVRDDVIRVISPTATPLGEG